jgi:nickel-dependent lactate racemase
MISNIPYGISKIEFGLSSVYDTDIILPNTFTVLADPESRVYNSLKNPIDVIETGNISQGKKIGISVNDATRPVPNSILLPPLLDYLEQKGMAKEDITFFIATGTHKTSNSDEVEQIFPSSIIRKYPIHRHDCDDSTNLELLCKTSRNTPIYINKLFFHQDAKIVVGNIEPHHFMGYSGGAKSAAIGLAGRETIRMNHSHLMEPNSFIGNYDSNPTRLDLEEIGDKIQITAALNVVLNSDKEIVSVLWGTPRGVMKGGIPISRQVCQKKIEKKYDLIIASPGGYPKDINLYQAQKAITHVSLIARKNGVIILAAECREGLGSHEFENYFNQFNSFQDVINNFINSRFEIGPHKAYQLALQAVQNRIILVSSINASILEKTHLEFTSSLENAVELASNSLMPDSAIAIVPYATNTMLY